MGDARTAVTEAGEGASEWATERAAEEARQKP
jgi:hypothetical protein